MYLQTLTGKYNEELGSSTSLKMEIQKYRFDQFNICSLQNCSNLASDPLIRLIA